jgi:hypothetical protein
MADIRISRFVRSVYCRLDSPSVGVVFIPPNQDRIGLIPIPLVTGNDYTINLVDEGTSEGFLINQLTEIKIFDYYHFGDSVQKSWLFTAINGPVNHISWIEFILPEATLSAKLKEFGESETNQ